MKSNQRSDKNKLFLDKEIGSHSGGSNGKFTNAIFRRNSKLSIFSVKLSLKNIKFACFLFVFSLLCGSAYGQKQRRASAKPPAAVSQPKQISSAAPIKSKEEQNALGNENIIRMVKGNFEENIVLNAIQTNETHFDVSVNALFELKNAGVSQKIIEAMQFVVKNKQQSRAVISNNSPSKNASSVQPVQRNSVLIADAQALPVYGSASDLKDLKRIYISVENAQSRERIIKALNKAPQYQVVNDPQEAEIFLEYKILSRDDRSNTNDSDLRIKSQMNAVVIKDNRRVIAWSDTVDHVRKTLGGIGFRSTHNEIKLTERFLKNVKE